MEGMVQAAAGRRDPGADPEVGASDAGKRQGMADPGYENPMGHLQYGKETDLAESAAGEMAKRMSGAGSRPRNGPSAGTVAQQTVL